MSEDMKQKEVPNVPSENKEKVVIDGNSTPEDTEIDVTGLSLKMQNEQPPTQGNQKEKENANFFMIVTSICFYVVISLATVMVNKLVFSHLPHKFNFPLTLTCIQIVIAFILLLILCPMSQKFEWFNKILALPPFELHLEKVIKIIPAAVIFVGMISFNNFCLSFVDVTLYLVFRSLTVFFSMIFSYFILKQTTNKKVVLTIFVVVLGYMIGSFGGFSNDSFMLKELIIGGICGTLSSVFVSLNSILGKKAMVSLFDRNHWLFMIYQNFVSFLVFIPLILLFEFQEVIKFQYFLEWDFILATLGSGLLGFLINISMNLILKFTSPLTKEITATAKACMQPVFGWLLFHDKLNLVTVIGALVCIFGSFLYSYFRRTNKS